MKVEIPDSLIINLCGYHPNTDIMAAMRSIRDNKLADKTFLFHRIGEFVIQEADYEKS